MSKRIAIYPGSFDPITKGHLSIIQRAAALFPKLIVVVGFNPNKKRFFDVQQRMDFIREATASLPNVEVDSFSRELLITYARRVGATIVVRGLRNLADYRNELQQSKMNQQMMPTLETVFLLPDMEEMFVSSTLVREMIVAKGDYDLFVPQSVTSKRKERA